MSTLAPTDTTDTTGTETARGAWRVVAEREITTRIGQKSFQYSILAMVVGIVALVVLASLLGGKPTEYTVGVADLESAAIVTAASDVVDQADDGSSATPRELGSVAALERAVRDEDVDAALIRTDDGYQLVGDREVDGTLSAALASVASRQVLESNAEQQGADLAELTAGSTVSERLLDEEAEDTGPRQGAAFVFVLLFYLTAVTFGMTIAQSVVQEKESRVVEILAAAVPIRALLWGKIVGNTMLALGQIVVLVVTSVAALAATGDRDLLSSLGPAMAWYVVFFVLGFVALAGLWAVAGSLASRQEDLGATTMPGQIVLFAPYLLTVIAGETVKTVISMTPVLSAMVMPARMAEGGVPGWQIAVALVGNVLAVVLLVRLAARLYQRTLMRTERKIGYAEALRLSD